VISIIGDFSARAIDAARASARGGAASTITGVKAEPFALTSSIARRAARRQLNSCCAVKACRRATTDTVSPLS